MPVLNKKTLKYTVDPKLVAKELTMAPVLQRKADDSGWGLPGLDSKTLTNFNSREKLSVGELDLDAETNKKSSRYIHENHST